MGYLPSLKLPLDKTQEFITALQADTKNFRVYIKVSFILSLNIKHTINFKLLIIVSICLVVFHLPQVNQPDAQLALSQIGFYDLHWITSAALLRLKLLMLLCTNSEQNRMA